MVAKREVQRMKIIGLTGGIASGKSTVSRLLTEHGYAVIDADRIAWQLAKPDNFLWQAYYDRYGDKVHDRLRSAESAARTYPRRFYEA